MQLERATRIHRGLFQEDFHVFHAYFSKGEEPIYRSIVNNDHLGSKVILRNGLSFWGEDPRPIVMNNRKYVLTQRYVNKIYDVQNYVVDIETGEAELYKVDEPDFFYGKNWSPFVYQNKLWIINRFDPFTLLCDGKVMHQYTCKTNLPIANNNFTQYRGGANGIEVSDGVIFGIGHNTNHSRQPIRHVPYIWVLDFNVTTLSLMDMPDFPSDYNLCDPTSLWVEDEKMYVACYEGPDIWSTENQDYISSIYRVDYKKCIEKYSANAQVFQLCN